MKKIKIGKNMKEVRIMRGLTQENLGEKVHLSTNYIGLIYSGSVVKTKI